MEMMKAAVLTEPYKVEYIDAPKPQPQAGEVLIKVECTGVCGSELHAFYGLHALRKPPVILGHEMAGEVVALGAGASRFKLGDRVTVFPLYGCGSCYYCQSGQSNLCDHKTVLGTPKWTGSFAQYVTAPEKEVYLLPDSVSYEAGAFIEPLAVGLHAVLSAGVKAGDRVAILGSGTIGLCVAIAAKLAGAVVITAVDVVEFNLDKARTIAATHTLDSRDPQLAEKAKQICAPAPGFDAVFVTAGVPSLVEQAVQLTRKKGVIMVMATFSKPVELDIQSSRSQEKVITGTTMYYPSEYERVISLLAAGQIDIEPFITQRMKLQDTQAAFEKYQKREEGIVKILLSVD